NQTTQVTRTKDVAGGSRNINLATKEIDGMPITFMPSSRMYPAIDSLTINGTNDRGCVKSADSANVNFIIAVPGAINAIVDVNGSKYSPKTDDHTEDVDRFVFHIFHDVFIPKQSAKGIYVSIGS
ncbi:MAG: hypothetical protein J6K69_03450, partial [Candidatus Methanomethylophilaceae archaeon]|nr:hypothetical protein [Candidatus Methanomethylophilaceae archaeon]